MKIIFRSRAEGWFNKRSLQSNTFARFLVLLCYVLITSYRVFGDTEGGIPPYIMESADKKYLFVMLKGGGIDDPYVYATEKYPQSGMYRNNGSSTPLWTIDWSAHVFLPADGIHVVRRGRWGRKGDYGEEAISFFANGKLLKTYKVSDLVDLPWLLPESSSHYRWQEPLLDNGRPIMSTLRLLNNEELPSIEYESGVIFDENNQTMKIATLQGDIYVFDIRTGDVVSAHRPMRRAIILAFSVLVVTAALIIFWRYKKSRARLAKQL